MKARNRIPALSRDHDQARQDHWDRWLRRRTAALVAAVLLAVVIVAAAIFVGVRGSAPANNEAAQNNAIAALKTHEAAANKPQFPTASAQGDAEKRAVLCTSYTDQASATQIAKVTAACGWDGNGVADPVSGTPFWDQSPQLAQVVTSGGYSALPFDVQLAGSTGWLTYWVPVKQSGQLAQVAGVGAFLNYPPSFVINGCSADGSVQSDDKRIQAVNGLVAGGQGYAMPGQTIPFNGNGLTGATAGNATVCQGSGPTRIVLAPVTYTGPTPGAHFTEGIAFRTVQISTGEIRVSAIGIDVSFQPN
jgi:hypothetical protein